MLSDQKAYLCQQWKGITMENKIAKVKNKFYYLLLVAFFLMAQVNTIAQNADEDLKQISLKYQFQVFLKVKYYYFLNLMILRLFFLHGFYLEYNLKKYIVKLNLEIKLN